MNTIVQRKYELKKRAERQEETRRRIAQAALELHTEIGPARTTISAIAERAGVQRLTVYRHFPDELAITRACSSLHATLYPAPGPEQFAGIADPEERLRSALRELYAYYRRHEQLLTNVTRDLDFYPPEVQELVRTRLEARFGALVEPLAAGRPNRKALRPAVRHALRFSTWRSLVREEALGDREAVELMLRLVRSA